MGIEGVNGPETTTNHVMEAERTLGIEAARACIIREINHTMGAHGRGLHSSTFRLNVSAFCGIGGAFRGCSGGV